ncbi:MAG: polysaccharide deacetylase family protein, partial [Bacteroidota bacterium]
MPKIDLMPSLSKRIARKIIFPSMISLGLERLLSFRSKKKLAILCYHGVSPESSIEYNGRHITCKAFESHLKYFKKHFEVLPLKELFARAKTLNDKKNKIAIAITFDDGYLNNYEYAFPLLEKYKMPASFFVSSCCLTGTNILWPDYMDAIRNFQGEKGIKYKDNHFKRIGEYKFADPKTDVDLYTYVKHLG